MACKTCIAVIAVVYAVQLLCGASSEDLGSNSSESSLNESDYDYNSSCIYHYLKTSENKTVVINCTLDCGETLGNGMPCVNITYPQLNFTFHQNYSCTVGTCFNGTCPSGGKNVTCWAQNDNHGDKSLWETFQVTM
uniref:Evasin n=1 Tax=Rhipicephalus microplus TaxID=6941 RepID=A0A6G5A6F5_RHIMP